MSKEYERLRRLIATRDHSNMLARVRDYRKCERFIKNELGIDGEKIITDNHQRAMKSIRSRKYDMFVVGSDEVWKVRKKKSFLRSIVAPARPFPSPYFLDPSIPEKKVSYAASANTTDLYELSTDQISTLRRHLQAFDHISVRDNYTYQLLEEEFDIDSVYRVPDPTVMTEIPKKDVRSTLIKNGIDLEKPILGLHSDHDPLFEEIANRYRNRGYQVVSPVHSPYADVNLVSKVGPFEYYSLYEYFDMVATSSLHSTIFSLKNNTPFVTIDVSSRYRHHESKTYSLLDDFEMTDRHYDAVTGPEDDLWSVVKSSEASLNERHVSERITSLQEDGVGFLTTINEVHHASH